MVDRPWDGKDHAGGWQIAEYTPYFAMYKGDELLYDWKCPLRIGMPLQTRLEGAISKDYAAILTASVGNAVLAPLLANAKDWVGQGEMFCIALRNGMRLLFKNQYQGIGARVERP